MKYLRDNPFLVAGLACIAIVLVAGGVWGILNQPAATAIIILALGLGAGAGAIFGRAK